MHYRCKYIDEASKLKKYLYLNDIDYTEVRENFSFDILVYINGLLSPAFISFIASWIKSNHYSIVGENMSDPKDTELGPTTDGPILGLISDADFESLVYDTEGLETEEARQEFLSALEFAIEEGNEQ